MKMKRSSTRGCDVEHWSARRIVLHWHLQSYAYVWLHEIALSRL